MSLSEWIVIMILTFGTAYIGEFTVDQILLFIIWLTLTIVVERLTRIVNQNKGG